MIGDMRSQFGSMLADTQLLAKPPRGLEQAGPWIDDQSQLWNFYSKHVAVVSGWSSGCPAAMPLLMMMYVLTDLLRRSKLRSVPHCIRMLL